MARPDRGETMKAFQLRALLDALPPDTEIYVWTDDGRMEICPTVPLDYWSEKEKAADINLRHSLVIESFDPMKDGKSQI